MNRDELLSRLEKNSPWDFLVIGGGATGLGVALEATSRGFRTLLLEQSDFAKGTSSKSTKLIHGGVRYLQQGNVSLVKSALRERGRLLRNAPHIVRPLPLVIPTYSRWQTLYYTCGLKCYDLLAGKWRVERSKLLSARQIRELAPGLKVEGLRGGILFYDAQFDDTRLSMALARSCHYRGGVLLNYTKVTSLLKSKNLVTGATAVDQLTGTQLEIEARVIVNCTGAFSDQVRSLEGKVDSLISASQGSHVVLDRSFLAGSHSGVLIPNTSDGRVLFAIPWNDRVLAGTTDVPVDSVELEPKPLKEEIEFILSHLGRYLAKEPKLCDLLSVFAGIRPLVKSDSSTATASTSRDHQVIVSPAGMVSVLGGKWTTYRKMAEDAVEAAAQAAGLTAKKESVTKNLPLYDINQESGPDKVTTSLSQLISENQALAEPIHPSASYCLAEVVRAVREEWACTLEDVLARRTRLLILDARASMEAAPKVAALMAAEMNRDRQWQKEQVDSFCKVASRYLPRDQAETIARAL